MRLLLPSFLDMHNPSLSNARVCTGMALVGALAEVFRIIDLTFAEEVELLPHLNSQLLPLKRLPSPRS